MATALAAFAHDQGVDATHRVVLALDGAGWHTARTMVVPEGIDLTLLPPASPELQPVERVWPLVDEPVVNRRFPGLDELEAVLVTRCQRLRADRPSIRKHTRFHWWPSDPAAGSQQRSLGSRIADCSLDLCAPV